MEFKDILTYRKAFFDYLISNINSYNNINKTSSFSQGFARWYLSSFTENKNIVSEAFTTEENAYLVLTEKSGEVICYVFNVCEKVEDSSSSIRPDSFPVYNIMQFCQKGIEMLQNKEQNPGIEIKSLRFIYIVLDDVIPPSSKKALKNTVNSFKLSYPNISSNSIFLSKQDVLKKFSNFVIGKNVENYNVVGMFKNIIKGIETFARDSLFGRDEIAKLMILSMLSGIDSTIVSTNDFSIAKILEENIRLHFAGNGFLGKLRYKLSDPNANAYIQTGDDYQAVINSVFYITDQNTFDEKLFYKIMDSSPDNLVSLQTNRKIGILDIIYLREKAKKIYISSEIKFFLYTLKNKFKNYQSNSVNTRYEIPDNSWISFSLLFRISAILSGRKEVDYTDIVLIENAAYSFTSVKTGDKWISKLIRELIKANAFMPLHVEFKNVSDNDGILDFDNTSGGEKTDNQCVYINDLEGEHLNAKVTDSKVLFNKEDKLYTYDEAWKIFDKNEIRLQNLVKKYTNSFKHSNYYTHRYDAIILDAINARLSENSAEKAKLEKYTGQHER